MFQWNTRIATVFIVSAAMATTAAAQPQHKQGGAPAARPAPAAPTPHAAPAPHAPPAPRAAPAPHIAVPRAAPQMAAPRAAPHIAAPRAAPHIAAPRHAPPQAGGPPPARPSAACPPAPGAGAPPCAAAVCPFARRPTRIGDATARADAADRGGSRSATAASQRTGRPRWRESCTTEPAAKSGAARARRRFRFGTVRARQPQRRATTKRGSATGCDAAESGEPRRSTVCSPRPCGQRPTCFLRRRAAQPGLCQLGYRPRPKRAHGRELDLPRPVLQSAVATPFYAPGRDRVDRPAVLALRLLRLRRLHLLSLRV